VLYLYCNSELIYETHFYLKGGQAINWVDFTPKEWIFVIFGYVSQKGGFINMDIFDQYLFEDITSVYANDNLSYEDYEEIFQRFTNLTHIKEVQPYLLAMRYLGLGTKPERQLVLSELEKMIGEDDPLISGLYFDLLITLGKNGSENRYRLYENINNGYSTAYLKEYSCINEIGNYGKIVVKEEFDDSLKKLLYKAYSEKCEKVRVLLGEEENLIVESAYCINRGYASPFMLTNDQINYAEYVNARIILIQNEIVDLSDIIHILEQLYNNDNDKLVIIARRVHERVLETINMNIARGAFNRRCCIIEMEDEYKEIENIARILRAPLITNIEELRLQQLEKLITVPQIVSFPDKSYVVTSRKENFGMGDMSNIAKIQITSEKMLCKYCESVYQDKEFNTIDEAILKEIREYDKKYVVIQKGQRVNSYVKYIPGICLSGGYSSDKFINNLEMKCVDLSAVFVLVVLEPINSISDIWSLLEQIAENNTKLIIIGNRFSEDVISTILINIEKEILTCCCIELDDIYELDKIAKELNTVAYQVADCNKINFFELPTLEKAFIWNERSILVQREFSKFDKVNSCVDDENKVYRRMVLSAYVGGVNSRIQDEQYNYYLEIYSNICGPSQELVPKDEILSYNNELSLEEYRNRSKKVMKLISAQQFACAVMQDGTVVSSIPNYIYQSGKKSYVTDEWSDVVEVAVGDEYVVGLMMNGRVIATGENDMGQCDLSSWEHIVSIACGRNHTVGICSNGMVLAAGMNSDGQCEVDGLERVVQVAASQWNTIALLDDGTVRVCGKQFTDVFQWKDIVSISCGLNHIVGLKRDGSVIISAGDNNYIAKQMQQKVKQWNGIVAIAAYDNSTVGLKVDGTVVVCGYCEKLFGEVCNWNEIVAIDTGGVSNEEFIMGVKKDGKVIFAGKPQMSVFEHPRIDIYRSSKAITEWILFDCVETVARCEKFEENEAIVSRVEYEQETMKRKELELKKMELEYELSKTNWIFDRKRRNEIKMQIAEIELFLQSTDIT